MPTRSALQTLALLLTLTCAARAAETNAPAPPPTPYLRFIIAVEDTANMKRLREPAADAVSRLLLGGFNGRAQPGDYIALWLVGTTVSTSSFPVISWDPAERVTTSSQSFRLLRDLESDATAANLTDLLMALSAETATGAQTTVYFVSSASEPMLGTPFDAHINSIFARHGKGMRKARKPFVTVLLSDAGRWVAHAVTPGDRAPYVPPFPKRPKPAQTAAPPPPAKTNRPAPLIMIGTNRMLSVEEIQRTLNETQRAPATNAPPTP